MTKTSLVVLTALAMLLPLTTQAQQSAKALLADAQNIKAPLAEAKIAAVTKGGCPPGYTEPGPTTPPRYCVSCPDGYVIKNMGNRRHYCASCTKGVMLRNPSTGVDYCSICPPGYQHRTNKIGVHYCVSCPPGSGPEVQTNPSTGVHYCWLRK